MGEIRRNWPLSHACGLPKPGTSGSRAPLSPVLTGTQAAFAFEDFMGCPAKWLRGTASFRIL
ncbi:hypothetical protein NOVOSPHI9U_10438 [Novosphingobium sp. 9U]|nr:hypothetical protein NOVOSPHI9U_10438 [Novosphingobium sp. 9U]